MPQPFVSGAILPPPRVYKQQAFGERFPALDLFIYFRKRTLLPRVSAPAKGGGTLYVCVGGGLCVRGAPCVYGGSSGPAVPHPPARSGDISPRCPHPPPPPPYSGGGNGSDPRRFFHTSPRCCAPDRRYSGYLGVEVQPSPGVRLRSFARACKRGPGAGRRHAQSLQKAARG